MTIAYPYEVAQKLEDAIGGIFAMELTAEHDAPEPDVAEPPPPDTNLQNSSAQPQTPPKQQHTPARPITALLSGNHDTENLSMHGTAETAAPVQKIISWTGGQDNSSLPAPPNSIPASSTVILSSLKKVEPAIELERKYQYMVHERVFGRVDIHSEVWSGVPVPYRTSHKGTGEQLLCSKGAGRMGNPVDYKANGEVVKMRPGRYGGKDAVSRKKETERGGNLKLCADCYVAMKVGLKK